MSGRTSREPTVRQRQQARQEGFVPISREFIFAVGFSLLAVCLWLRGPGLFDHLGNFVKSQFAAATLPGELNGVEEIRRSAVLLVRELSPFLLTIVATVYLGHWVQQGPLWTPDRLAPDVSRLDPARGGASNVSAGHRVFDFNWRSQVHLLTGNRWMGDFPERRSHRVVTRDPCQSDAPGCFTSWFEDCGRVRIGHVGNRGSGHGGEMVVE